MCAHYWNLINTHLTNTFLIFKSTQGTKEKKGAVLHSASLFLVKFTKTDSSREQKLGINLGKGSESKTHPTFS